MRSVLLQKKDEIGSIILNRPKQRNALSIELMDEFQRTLYEIAKDESVHVVIIKGNGPIFCSGHDITELIGEEHDSEYYRKIFASCSLLMQTLQKLPQPVIAQVHGAALAAGCQLVCECDLAIADTNTVFSTPGVKIGLFCSTPMVPLSRTIGRKRTMEMLFTGRSLSAQTAKDIGLINEVVSPELLDETTKKLALNIKRYSPSILELGKRAFYHQLDEDQELAYEHGIEIMTENCLLEDAQEGMKAFLEKRKPKWKRR
jgi:enoyl-CoA hydratase/carnithine racemase